MGITDALNLSQTSKILLTAYALGVFAQYMLLYHFASFYQTTEYNQASITIPNPFDSNPLHFNIVDFAHQSAQILAIFSAKQIFAVIRNPKKASIIKKNPFLIYEDREDADVNVKSVRMWKIICIGWWIVAILYGCLLFATHKGKGLLIICILLLIIAICLQISGSIKELYTANIIILITPFLGYIGYYLFEWDPVFVTGIFFGFGFSAIYTLKIKQFKKDKTKQTESKAMHHVNGQTDNQNTNPALIEIEKVQHIHEQEIEGKQEMFESLSARGVSNDAES